MPARRSPARWPILAALASVVALLVGVGAALLRAPSDAPPPASRPVADGPCPTGSGGGGDDGGFANGGVFHRLAPSASPLSAPSRELVIRLFSPYPAIEECLDHCPPQLRLLGGEEGGRSAVAALAGVAEAIECLARQPGLDHELAAALRSTIGALEDSASGRTKRRLRALLVRGVEGIPAGASYGLGLSLSDLHDPYFDHHRAPRGGGVRLLVNRIQGAGSRRGEPGGVLGGVIEFAGDGVGGGDAAFDVAEVRELRHPLGLHFWSERVPVVGLGIDAQGRLFTYGYWGEAFHHLPENAAVRSAVEAVLRRL